MTRLGLVHVLSLGALIVGCGDPGGREASGGGSGIGDSGGDGEAGDGDGEAGEGTAEGDGDGEAGDGDGEAGDGDGDGEAGDGDGDSDGGDTKWDTLSIPDAPACGGPGGGNEDPEFSYIWVANSSQGAISKINTKTIIEEGRYYTRQDNAGSPSRTSVNLAGDVAVANRSGGVAKFYANPDDCQESNGMQGLQTSNNNQPLPWATEECRAWFIPMNYTSQRPVAWTAGEWDDKACGYGGEQLWTAGTSNSSQTVDVYLLDGEDGSTDDMVVVNGLASSFYGIYGAAVDGDGNMWGSQLGSSGKLLNVRIDDMSYDIYNNPAPWHWYGMTVDSDGYVWVCSSTGPGRFDPANDSWQTAQVGGYTGCMADTGEDGLLWMSTGQGVQGVNRETLQVEKSCPSTNGSYGISIDFEGYVWAVASGSNANRVDPETCQYQTYSGLTGAYTYSDMTGFALVHAGNPNG
jgi:hypothetical protein